MTFVYDYVPTVSDVIEVRDDDDKYKVKIDNILSSNVFEFSYESEMPMTSNYEVIMNDVVAFGTYINDFHILDKQAIYTVGIGAIQELDRQIIDLKAENTVLQDKINILSSHIFGSNMCG